MDTFGRTHSDLRISVTDRCNIRCYYCMPETGATFTKAADLLSFDEIERFVSAAVPFGIQKIRLTGGEPLMRPKLPELIAKLSAIPGIRDLALTTNGVLLAEAAQPLYDAACAASTSTSIPSTASASATSPAAMIWPRDRLVSKPRKRTASKSSSSTPSPLKASPSLTSFRSCALAANKASKCASLNSCRSMRRISGL